MTLLPGLTHALISHQCVSGSVQNWNEKRFSRFTLDTTKDALPFDSMASMVLVLTALALVDFNSLFGTADPLRAALKRGQHGLTPKLSPVSNGGGAKVML
jgi:hypothetical protein